MAKDTATDPTVEAVSIDASPDVPASGPRKSRKVGTETYEKILASADRHARVIGLYVGNDDDSLMSDLAEAEEYLVNDLRVPPGEARISVALFLFNTYSEPAGE